jgi:hypothetical protein
VTSKSNATLKTECNDMHAGGSGRGQSGNPSLSPPLDVAACSQLLSSSIGNCLRQDVAFGHDKKKPNILDIAKPAACKWLPCNAWERR